MSLSMGLLDEYRVRRFRRDLPLDIANVVNVELGVGDIVIDLGANIGMATSIFESRGSTVYAIEPNPYAFRKLERRFRKNPQVFPIEAAAVIDDTEFVSLFMHTHSASSPLKYSTGSSLMDNKPNVDSSSFISVRALNLVSLIQSLGKIKILKMDVEGYETKLIPAIINSGAISNIDYLFVETHEEKWANLVADTAYMKSLALSSPSKGKFFFNWP